MYQREIKHLKSYINSYSSNFYDCLKKNECIIAGGMVRSIFTNDKINDIDIYFRDEKSLLEVLAYFWEERKYTRTITDKSILLTVPKDKQIYYIQLCFFKYFDSPESIFETYDFTNCMGAFDFKDETYVLHEYFLIDNLQKRLVFNEKTAFPIVSALRVDKYKKRGYGISKKDFVKIIVACNNLKIDSWETLESHIGGMYGKSVSDVFDTDKTCNYENIMEALNLLESDVEFGEMSWAFSGFNVNVNIDKNEEKYEDFYMELLKKSGYVIRKCGKFYFDENLKMTRNPKIPETEAKEYDIDIIEIKPEDVGIVKIYKYVKKIDDTTFVSHWKKTFVYKLGVPIVDHLGIYCYIDKEENHTFKYINYKDSILIEMETTIDKLIHQNSNIYLTRECTPIRIVKDIVEDHDGTEPIFKCFG